MDQDNILKKTKMMQKQRQEQRSRAPAVGAGDTLLVLHDAVNLAGQGRLTWAQTGVLGHDAGFAPHAVPAHLLAQSHAWESSWGERALGTLDATQARLAQVQFLRSQMSEALHVFEGGSPSLWRAVQDANVAWLGSCAPGTVVMVDDTPTRAATLARLGTEVKRQELRVGDLVFFNTRGRRFSHMGIYLGDHQFVHAPRKGAVVRVERMDKPYWQKRYNGARRLDSTTLAGLASASVTS